MIPDLLGCRLALVFVVVSLSSDSTTESLIEVSDKLGQDHLLKERFGQL